MAAVTTIITTVVVAGTVGIAAAYLATKTNLFTALHVSVLIQNTITVVASVLVGRPHLSAMATAMTIITTAAANMMGVIAVVSVAPSTSIPTARSASAKMNRTNPNLIAMANAVYLIILATVGATMKTIIVHADGMLVTAAEPLGTSGNFRIARSVSARTLKLKRKTAAPEQNNAGWPLMWAMVVVTITTTTAVAIGIKETAVEPVVIRDNFYTAVNANAQTLHFRRAIAPANAGMLNTKLTVGVMTTTTIVAATGTVVTVAE